jgi:LysR family glycine cleavage system transcriptional activator
LPLNAVRVFARVGRLLNLSQAANELNVTPSAISHQIRALEEYLGVALLRRVGNKLTLTSAGRLYLHQVSEGLMQLTRATKTLKATKGQRILKISAAPSVATLWLMPRISRFMKAHPQIALALTASRELADFAQGQFDVAIWYGQAPKPGLRVEPLCQNELFPVCSPKLLKKRPPLREPSDLRHHTLLDSSDEIYYREGHPGWQGWLQAAEVPDITGIRYLSFSPRTLLHRAVIDELGVGLSRTLLAADFLASGQLACPFGPSMPLASTYNLVCPESVADRADIAAFRAWIMKEAAESKKQLDIAMKR